MGKVKHSIGNKLVWKNKDGDSYTFEKLYKEFSRQLYFIAVGLLGDRLVAEDAVQECFVWLWTHRDELDKELSVEHYLRKSVRNYALNYLRHQKIVAEKEPEVNREHLFWNEGDGQIEEELERKVAEVRSVIDTLPEECRRIFVMAVIEGMGYAKTAENLGISVNTVKSQVKIAYKKIKNNIDKGIDNKGVVIYMLLSIEKFF